MIGEEELRGKKNAERQKKKADFKSNHDPVIGEEELRGKMQQMRHAYERERVLTRQVQKWGFFFG